MAKLQVHFQQFDRGKSISCVDIVTYPCKLVLKRRAYISN